MTQNKNNVSNNKISFKIKKHKKDNPKVKNEKFNKKIDTHKILDTIEIGKNFDFDKYNVNYSWDDEDYYIEYIKKKESESTVYLVCRERGNNSQNCPGKAKYNKETGVVEIYIKCDDKKNSFFH